MPVKRSAKRTAKKSSADRSARQHLAEMLQAKLPGSELSWKFGHASLTVNDKIFAFTRTGGGVILKLPQDRIRALMEAEEATPLKMGARTMREWVVLSDATSPSVERLLRQAQTYVASLPASSKKRPKSR